MSQLFLEKKFRRIIIDLVRRDIDSVLGENVLPLSQIYPPRISALEYSRAVAGAQPLW
jgi:hypothetical protein